MNIIGTVIRKPSRVEFFFTLTAIGSILGILFINRKPVIDDIRNTLDAANPPSGFLDPKAR
ncbi:hypothetical protein [Acetobacter sp. DsW_063]|uniref:hypothetical protein n=1 Tax=Acetobacter sp. DsW_063 TaxID=1514894 RepID=UPI000A37D0E3|nr:hypothetical protein [Acetobacter sp. DsW_063]OUJ11035.1 hypothetical protein HK28_04820 [Acetobacter sp. DsW_063]